MLSDTRKLGADWPLKNVGKKSVKTYICSIYLVRCVRFENIDTYDMSFTAEALRQSVGPTNGLAEGRSRNTACQDEQRQRLRHAFVEPCMQGTELDGFSIHSMQHNVGRTRVAVQITRTRFIKALVNFTMCEVTKRYHERKIYYL